VDAEIASLAAAAATALVGAMTTDGWQSVKEGIMSVWRRARPGQAGTVAGELENSRALATASLAEGADPAGQVTQKLVGKWQSRLAQLLESEPALAQELGAMLTSWGAQASGTSLIDNSVRIDSSAAGHSRVNIAARDIHVTESER
jgi:hypothetical protein